MKKFFGIISIIIYIELNNIRRFSCNFTNADLINMKESFSSPTDFSSITSSLKIDEAIQRSRKVMEESKALTCKNSKKQSIIDEKLKSDLTLNPEKYPYPPKPLESINYHISPIETPKISYYPKAQEPNHLEFRNLGNKISNQMTQIRLLQMNNSELKIENSSLIDENRQLKQRNKQEIQYLTELYEEKLRNSDSSNNILAGMEKRLKELEENFSRQVEYNLQLERRIEAMNRVDRKVFKDIESQMELEKNLETIAKFQDRLDKAEKLVGDILSTKNSVKKGKKCKDKNGKKKKLSKEL